MCYGKCMKENQTFGTIAWADLTVDDAPQVRDFYSKVLGWVAQEHDMGDYSDYEIYPNAATDSAIAGICHKRGANANIPSQWLLYVTVEDVQAAANRCTASGGKVIEGPRKMGGSDFCIIRNPAGAILALITP